MTVQTITGYTTIGVDLASNVQSTVSIAGTGVINASTSYSAAVYSGIGVIGTVLNSGTLMAASGSGIVLASGGTVVNGSGGHYNALISVSEYAIRTQFRGTANVINYGTIVTTNNNTQSIGITLRGGGSATNGSVGDVTAYIHSYQSGIVSLGPNTTVANFGTIVTTGTNKASYGVYLRAGGVFTNGSNLDTAATIISNARGASAGIYQATIINYGTIEVTQSTTADVVLLEGGRVVNGSSADTTAYLESVGAGRSVYVKGPSESTVVNYGTIGGGVCIRPGGTVINGSNVDTQAKISATLYGVNFQGPLPSLLTNYGTISGNQQKGVILSGGGTIVNGSASDVSAYLSGNTAIAASGTAPAYVINFGTIAANRGSTLPNVILMGGGEVVNGSLADRTASIIGGNTGIWIPNGIPTIVNYGTITGTAGVSFYRSGPHPGVTMTGAGTVINAGTIESTAGTSGIAIRFGSGNERLVIDPGSVLIGRVIGGTGSNTLELAGGGQGTLAGLGSSFSNFGTVTVDNGAHWTFTGSNSLAYGSTINQYGNAIINGDFINSGSILGGLSIAAGATFTNYGTIGRGGTAVNFASGGLLQVGAGAAMSGQIAGAGLTSLELLGGSTGTISGFDGSNGTITTGGKSASLAGMGGTLTVDSNANWTFYGSTSLGNPSGVNIQGAVTVSSDLTLTSAGTILISGQNASLLAETSLALRGATLDVTANGAVEVGSAGAPVPWHVVIDASSTMSGYGTIEAPVTDNGTLLAQGGTLTVTGRVTGNGNVTVGANATLLSQTGLNESNLVFNGGNATVEVSKSTPIGPTISGFGATDTIDFLGTVATSLSFNGGALGVNGPGGNIAVLHFAGNYTASNFKLTADGHGGTDLITVGLAAAAVRQAAYAGSGLSDLNLPPGSSPSTNPLSEASAVPAGNSHGVAIATSYVAAWLPHH